jgi:hypothetical protein
MRSILLAFFIVLPFGAIAQNSTPEAPASDQLLKAEELDALVAPVALYPDTLLAEVLMASTYPLEVVQADRWRSKNKNLKGDELKAAVDKQGWDESVKSLVATSSVLEMMSRKLDWTQKLGDAVLAQQADVMDAIQRLRARAEANNKLTSTKEQKVTVKQEQNKRVIVIEPTAPETVYVPYYDPAVVFGTWPYPAYPPYYFDYPSYIPSAVIATGIAFGAGYILGRWASGGYYWGGGINWGGNNVIINRPININNIGNNWQHRPEHRQGVRYNNTSVQQRFGNNNLRSSSQGRTDFRGRGGEQVLRPNGGERANVGSKPITRPSEGGGKKAAARPSQGGGKKAAARPSQGGGKKAAARPSQGGGKKAAARPSQGGGKKAAARPSKGGGNKVTARPSQGNAFGGIEPGRMANFQSQRGQASLGGGFGGPPIRIGGGGFGGGGGYRGGGGGGFRGGGGRRSDIRLKHDISLIGRLGNGLGFYRFMYNGSDKAYVGVIAQEVQRVEPEAVVLGRDGYLRVFYDKLGLKLETYEQWIASGARIPPVLLNER